MPPGEDEGYAVGRRMADRESRWGIGTSAAKDCGDADDLASTCALTMLIALADAACWAATANSAGWDGSRRPDVQIYGTE